VPRGPDEPLDARSLAEAYLYLMATPCAACSRGPLKGADARPYRAVPTQKHPPPVNLWQIEATCAACQAVTTATFRLPGSPDGVAGGESADAAVVNPTDEPSRILDVGQWIMLFRMITEAASRETDKIQARHLGLEAAQCLEEALKFFDEPDNDLPPPEALFTEASKQRFRKSPEQFSRRRLIDLRAKLPTTSVMRSRLLRGKKTPWWRRRSG
jgi:hypothetical protein